MRAILFRVLDPDVTVASSMAVSPGLRVAEEDHLTTTSPLWERFAEQRDDHPRSPALVSDGHEWSFVDLSRDATAIAAALRRLGVPDGAVVGVALPNGAAFVAGVLALFQMSATVGLLPHLFRLRELEEISRRVGFVAYLTSPDRGDEVLAAVAGRRVEAVALPSGPDLCVVLTPGAAGDGAQEDGTALIKFSSGSTGVPKGIGLARDNVLAEAENVVAGLGLEFGGRVLAPVPLCHSYGFDLGVLPMIWAGVTLDARPSFVPRAVVRALVERPGTVLLGVPVMYRILQRQRRAPSLADASLISCTAPLPTSVARGIGERFGAYPRQHYGSSEAGAVSLIDAADAPMRPDSVGRPMAGVSIDIVGEAGILGPGDEGEIVVRGAAVARGYVMGAGNRPGALSNGVFRSGDVGLIDESGLLYVRGRLDALINVGGAKVSPEEVQTFLESVPSVIEAHVMGIPDPDSEEVVVAAVVDPEGQVTEADLLHRCREQMADYKVPRRILVVRDLPRGPTGKARLEPEDFLP